MEYLGTALVNLGLAIKLAKDASDAVREIKDTDFQDEKNNLEIAAQKVEKSVSILKAELAKSFDYQLCKCTFPPQVCTLVGHDEKTRLEISQCPNCGRKYPPVFGI